MMRFIGLFDKSWSFIRHSGCSRPQSFSRRSVCELQVCSKSTAAEKVLLCVTSFGWCCSILWWSCQSSCELSGLSVSRCVWLQRLFVCQAEAGGVGQRSSSEIWFQAHHHPHTEPLQPPNHLTPHLPPQTWSWSLVLIPELGPVWASALQSLCRPVA